MRRFPAGLKTSFRQALEKDRELRYQQAADVRADLQRLKRDFNSASVMPLSASSSATAPAGSSGERITAVGQSRLRLLERGGSRPRTQVQHGSRGPGRSVARGRGSVWRLFVHAPRVSFTVSRFFDNARDQQWKHGGNWNLARREISAEHPNRERARESPVAERADRQRYGCDRGERAGFCKARAFRGTATTSISENRKAHRRPSSIFTGLRFWAARRN